MTQPMQFPDPARQFPPGSSPVPGVPDAPRPAAELRRALVISLAVVAGTALLGVLGGFLWAVIAPRAALVMVGRGAANLVNSETNAFIAADGWYCLVCLAGGVISGLLGHRLAVRRHGPAAMAAVLIGGLAASLITWWVGEQSGLATFHHLLATLPAGAHLRAQLALGSRGAIAFWPLAAGLMAGGAELTAAKRDRRRVAAPPLVLAPSEYRDAAPGYQGAPPGYRVAPPEFQGGPPGYRVAPPEFQGGPLGFQGGPPRPG
jgi:hypothetical protein